MTVWSTSYLTGFDFDQQQLKLWEVVVAQLAERSLMIPEDPGSIPVIGNF